MTTQSNHSFVHCLSKNFASNSFILSLDLAIAFEVFEIKVRAFAVSSTYFFWSSIEWAFLSLFFAFGACSSSVALRLIRVAIELDGKCSDTESSTSDLILKWGIYKKIMLAVRYSYRTLVITWQTETVYVARHRCLLEWDPRCIVMVTIRRDDTFPVAIWFSIVSLEGAQLAWCIARERRIGWVGHSGAAINNVSYDAKANVNVFSTSCLENESPAAWRCNRISICFSRFR